MKERSDEKYSESETKARFEAALRGARLAGPQHAESVTPKKDKPQRKNRRRRNEK